MDSFGDIEECQTSLSSPPFYPTPAGFFSKDEKHHFLRNLKKQCFSEYGQLGASASAPAHEFLSACEKPLRRAVVPIPSFFFFFWVQLMTIISFVAF